MLRKTLLGIALVALLLTPAVADAQWTGYGWGWGGYRGGFYYGRPYYSGWSGYPYSPYYYGYGYGPVYTAPPVYSYQSFYGPTYTQTPAYVPPAPTQPAPAYTQPAPAYVQTAASPQPVAGPVYFNVQVPANAEVWFGGAKTNQTGTVRRFVTPPLPPGNRYKYDVVATWMNNGQPVTETRSVDFETGRQNELTVDLRPSQ